MANISIFLDQIPPVWAELLEALAIFATVADNNDDSPLVCEDDAIYVPLSPKKFTEQQIADLDGLGFSIDPDGARFYSTWS